MLLKICVSTKVLSTPRLLLERLELRVKGELSVFIFKCPASGCVLKISCLRSYATPDCVVRLYYTRET